MLTEPAISDLGDLSQADLIALIQRLSEEVRMLRAEVHRLREELAQSKKPPPTSHNSSQPPSRDWKADRPQRKRHKKVGAKPGHAKAERRLVDNPDKVIDVWAEACPKCGVGLLEQAPERAIRRQLTELPEIQPVVIETRQYEVRCPGCQRLQRGALPEGLEASRRFGPRLEALVTYLHHEHHLGFERLCGVMRDVFGTPLSEGGAVAIVERAGEAAQPEAEAIGERVRQSAVIASDETSARVHGRNHWEWVFIG
ncbi:MAG: IS66 family transposase, partial [Chloroflexi bacterium]|nr:IS66 family transposase [Chloroflexota bacterium]